jgi:hypothetical protein
LTLSFFSLFILFFLPVNCCRSVRPFFAPKLPSEKRGLAAAAAALAR